MIIETFRNVANKLGYKSLICGIGTSEIKSNSIAFKNYPFKPSFVYGNKEIFAKDITEIHLDTYPPTIKIKGELVFISRLQLEELSKFANENNVPLVKRNSNWSLINEPFLDTQFTEEQLIRTKEILAQNGFSESELKELRTFIGPQMYKYNAILWDWMNLGLDDVLSAMRKKLSQTAFEKFYWKAMEIEQRGEVQ